MQISLQIKKPRACVHTNLITSSLKNTKGISA